MSRSTAALGTCTLLLTGMVVAAPTSHAAQLPDPRPAALSAGVSDGAPAARYGASAQAHSRSLPKLIQLFPRRATPLLPRAPRLPTGVRLPRPVGTVVLREIPTMPATAPTVARSTATARVAVSRAAALHPADSLAVDFSRRASAAIQLQVEVALLRLLPHSAPTALRDELRRASMTVLKTSVCGGLEALVLDPRAGVSIDVGEVVAEVRRGAISARLKGWFATGYNAYNYVQSMRKTLSAVSRSAWLSNGKGQQYSFDPSSPATSLLVRLGAHPAVWRAVPTVLGHDGRPLTRAAFLWFRTCYSPR